MKHTLAQLSLVCALSVAVSTAHAVSIAPVSSSLSLAASARADNNGLPAVLDAASDSQGATLDPLQAVARAISQDGNAYLEVFASGAATLAADSGSARISAGWTSRNVSDGSALATQGLDFEFKFTSLINGTFGLAYDVAGSGTDTFGLNGFGIAFSGPDGFDWKLANLGQAGVLSYALESGEDYVLTLSNFANINGGLGTREALLEGKFEWWAREGTPVPDATATLGLLSLGLLGLAVMRQRF